MKVNVDHPRFPQRLQTVGGLLLVAGITAHMLDHRGAAFAGLLVTFALVLRAAIEFAIRQDEPEQKLRIYLRRMNLLTQFSLSVAIAGLLNLIYTS